MKQMVYIITGASSDIGIAFLKSILEELNQCMENNIKIICQYHTHFLELAELQQSFPNADIQLCKCDLSSVEETENWIAQIKESGIVPSHILHLAASPFQYMRLKQFDWDRTNLELNIQVCSFAQLLKAFLPAMKKEKYGKIAVMLTSYTLGVPPKYMSDYIITKYALLGLMKSAASEYSGTGVTINGLSPNMIETKFLSDIDKKIIDMTADSSSMRRNVNIQEVVAGLKFLLSDASSYMNGVNLNMSGGDKM